MEFKRPEDSLYPRIYKTFSVNNEEFYITDLTEDYAEEALELLTQYVIPEENFCKALQIHTKPNAMKIMVDKYRQLFKRKMSLACFRTKDGELVGLNILGVTTRGATSHPTADDPDLKMLGKSREFTSSLFDIFDHFPDDNFLDAFGLGVKSEYRGRGIAVELLACRAPLLKALGLSLTVTSFSTLNSQKAASKAGYEEVFSISYKELQSKFPQYDFSHANGTHSKIFIMRL